MIGGIMPAGYAVAVSGAYPNMSQSCPESGAVSGNKTWEDTVTISGEAKRLSLSGLLPSAGEGAVSIGDIKEAFTDAVSSVEKRLQSLCRQTGISSDVQMEISVNCDGSIRVNGKSPESDTLEQAINADDGLANTIRGMSAHASLLDATERHRDFAEAYEQDPAAALDLYGCLFEDGHEYNVSFLMQNGHIETKVEYL